MTQAGDCGPILVVDDDEPLRNLLTELLGHAGYTADAVRSGGEAAQIVETERPALVILDVCLPDLSGYEVCRRIRARYGDDVPVLFISGERTETVDRVAGLLLGGDDYLVKPFAVDELLARVAALLRRAHRSPAADAPALTPREREVLELLAHGLAHAEIADRLVISRKTVGTHVAHIYEKLGARSRVQALAAGYRHRLVEPMVGVRSPL
jgi:DNA-binding NarL/FixJ family response regulator